MSFTGLAVLMLFLAAAIAGANPRVICSDAGAGGYQAFPDVVRLENGELLCVFYAGYGHIAVPNEQLPRGGRIVSIRSNNNGTSWSKPEIVVDTPLDDRDPHITRLADGTLMVSFFTRTVPKKTDKYSISGTCNVYTVRSKDNGKSWEKIPKLVARGYACSAPVRQLRDGTLVQGVYHARTGGGFESGVVRSTDNGKSWSKPILFSQASGHSHDETDVIELPSGKLLAMIRPCMCRTVSEDKGLTWSDPKPVGWQGHAAYLLRTSQGILLCAHRIPNTALHWSLDDGNTWSGPVELDKFIGAYPSMVELPDNRILCVYYEEGPQSAIRQIIFRATKSGIEIDGQ